MTQEEEITALRLENQELRIKIRKHRMIGEQAESDLRAIHHLVEKIRACAEPLLQRTEPDCIRCLSKLAKIVELLKTSVEDDSPPPKSAVD